MKRQPIKCEWCGKVFTPEHCNEKYCSDECKKEVIHHRNNLRQAKHGEVIWYKKVCPVCGDRFVVDRDNVKYCSDECSEKATKYKSTKVWEERVCPECGKVYKCTQAKKSEYCCYLCKYHAEHHHDDKKVCPECGKVFTPKNALHTYCSHQCEYRFTQKRCRSKKRELLFNHEGGCINA